MALSGRLKDGSIPNLLIASIVIAFLFKLVDAIFHYSWSGYEIPVEVAWSYYLGDFFLVFMGLFLLYLVFDGLFPRSFQKAALLVLLADVRYLVMGGFSYEQLFGFSVAHFIILWIIIIGYKRVVG